VNLEKIIGENLKNMKDMSNLKIHANHPKLEHTNAIKMARELSSISITNTISDRIDALKICKKSKKGALIKEMLFTEETADTQTIMSVTKTEAVSLTMTEAVSLIKTEAVSMEIKNIETMLINLVYRKTFNRLTKMNNHLKTVKMIKMLNNQ